MSVPAAVVVLEELADLGVELDVRADRLRFRPRSRVTHELRERLKANKASVMSLLALVGSGYSVEVVGEVEPGDEAVFSVDVNPGGNEVVFQDVEGGTG